MVDFCDHFYHHRIIFISTDFSTESEKISYVNGDYYLDHNPNINDIVLGVDPTTGTITCDADVDVDNFADCGGGKWPVYNELLFLVQIVSFISAGLALMATIVTALKGKGVSSGVLVTVAIGAFVTLPSPSLMSVAEGLIVDVVKRAINTDPYIVDFHIYAEIFKYLPAFVIFIGLIVLISAAVASVKILSDKLSSFY